MVGPAQACRALVEEMTLMWRVRLLATALFLWPALACQPAAPSAQPVPAGPGAGVSTSAAAVVPTSAASGPVPTIAALAAQASTTPAPVALRFGLNTTTAEV